ncbi:MAG: bifunctional methylenetetrahydrofolate dehydrogenase/methenyltetrahydrofolate cyclohydrolase FolD [Myxococcota bacterium]
MGLIIDGRAVAKKVRAEVKARIDALSGRKPHLVVVLVGDDPASTIYVRNKGRAADEVGLRSTQHKLPEDTPPEMLLSMIEELNRDDDVDGILVQLPLPKQHDPEAVLRSIAPHKDVDGLHPENAGRLSRGDESALIPCTPRGCIRLLEEVETTLQGARAVVVGRSRLVGRPMADLFLNRSATVTVCHSRTQHLDEVIAEADVLVGAVGRPLMIKGRWIKFGATVIDVGINRDTRGKLVGDVDFVPAAERARAITPVPGGVGPMTIACLLDNAVKAFERRRNCG